MKLRKTLFISSLTAFSLNTYSAPEITGKLTYEMGTFSTDYVEESIVNTSEVGKNEFSGRVYFDGDSSDLGGSDGQPFTYHAEFQLYGNQKAGEGLTGVEDYTQRDLLREAYIDTNVEDWAVRAGKQQVVWGTADGAKFLDIINPTDYSEMAQNQMEDSRIPVWMINAEKYLDDGSSIQAILSQSRENYFSGLNREIDTGVRSNGAVSSIYKGSNGLSYGGDTASVSHNNGNKFILKGVDTITGGTNGFLNIAPDLGTVATLFGRAFTNQDNSDLASVYANNEGTTVFNGLYYGTAANDGAMTGFTVGGFNSATKLSDFSAALCEATDRDDVAGCGAGGANKEFSDLAFGGTNFWLTDSAGFGYFHNPQLSSDYSVDANGDGVNDLYRADGRAAAHGQVFSGQQALAGFAGMFGTNLLNTDSAINSTFEYMNRTPFATFDAFVNARSQYVLDMPKDTDSDISFRYKNTLNDGSNYTLNYSYQYDKNPVIDVSWRDPNGNKLTTVRGKLNNLLQQVDGTYDPTGGNGWVSSFLTLKDASGNEYGGQAQVADANKYATLRMTQTLKRAHNIGASFDKTIETDKYGPVVLRAEGVYQKGVYQPVIDRGALSIGDLEAALTMRKGNRFKYVVGADITALTNMMVSLQFIQDINLDYIDNKVDFDGEACTATRAGGKIENCGVYSLDFASMHLSNGLKKADKTKEFVSIYFSKPYGESGQHRWNNITMVEEGGGRWNRFDTEYTLDDNTVLTAEWNKYFGNENTQFGQLRNSSNVQLGVKYSF